jgi:hypothetical protein
VFAAQRVRHPGFGVEVDEIGDQVGERARDGARYRPGYASVGRCERRQAIEKSPALDLPSAPRLTVELTEAGHSGPRQTPSKGVSLGAGGDLQRRSTFAK